MADKLFFDVELKAVQTPTDVVKRLVDVSVDGVAVPQVEAGIDAAALSGYVGAENATVTVQVTRIDNAGNTTPSAVLPFTLLDTISPDPEMEFGLRVTAEEAGDAPVVEEPPVEEPPVEEPPMEEPPVEEPPTE